MCRFLFHRRCSPDHPVRSRRRTHHQRRPNLRRRPAHRPQRRRPAIHRHHTHRRWSHTAISPLTTVNTISFRPPISGVLSGGILPGDWAVRDVGDTGLAGSANYGQGVFTLCGEGSPSDWPLRFFPLRLSAPCQGRGPHRPLRRFIRQQPPSPGRFDASPIPRSLFRLRHARHHLRRAKRIPRQAQPHHRRSTPARKQNQTPVLASVDRLSQRRHRQPIP